MSAHNIDSLKISTKFSNLRCLWAYFKSEVCFHLVLPHTGVTSPTIFNFDWYPRFKKFPSVSLQSIFLKFLRFCNLFVWKVFYPKKIAIWISFGFSQQSAILLKFSCNRQKGKYNSLKITLHQLKNFNDWTHGNIHWKFWPRYIVSKLHCDGFPWFTRRSIRSFNILSLRKPPGHLNLFTLVRLKYRPSGPQLCSNAPPKGRIWKYVFFSTRQ